jgi:hypothetical protein
MHFRIIPLLLTLLIGCRTASKTAQMRALADNNKDIIVLAYLIRDHMRTTHSSKLTLEDIIKRDTLGRIAKNFSSLEVGNWPDIWRGGFAVYFKYADGRNNDSVKLTPNERIPWKIKMKKEIGRNETQLAKKFDGEIHFYYPERHYHITEIIIKTPSN